MNDVYFNSYIRCHCYSDKIVKSHTIQRYIEDTGERIANYISRCMKSSLYDDLNIEASDLFYKYSYNKNSNCFIADISDDYIIDHGKICKKIDETAKKLILEILDDVNDTLAYYKIMMLLDGTTSSSLKQFLFLPGKEKLNLFNYNNLSPELYDKTLDIYIDIAENLSKNFPRGHDSSKILCNTWAILIDFQILSTDKPNFINII